MRTPTCWLVIVLGLSATIFQLVFCAVKVSIAEKRERKEGDGHEVNILFVGDGTVVQGDSGTHGFIDILQAESATSPLTIDAVGALNVNLLSSSETDNDNKRRSPFSEDHINRIIQVFQPDVMVLMLCDDSIAAVIDSLASARASSADQDKGSLSLSSSSSSSAAYADIRTRLTPIVRRLESVVAHVQNVRPACDIVLSTPLLFHAEEEIAEEVCEVHGGMLKKVSFDYGVGLVDLRFSLMKVFENHANYDRIRHEQDSSSSSPTTDHRRQGAALPATVTGQGGAGGGKRYLLSEKAHSIIAHALVCYFELDEYERNYHHSSASAEAPGNGQDASISTTNGIEENGDNALLLMKERVLRSRLSEHLKALDGIGHKHLESWHRDSSRAIEISHDKRRERARIMEEAHQLRVQEEMRLSGMGGASGGAGVFEENAGGEGLGLTASQRKRAKKKMKKKMKPGAGAGTSSSSSSSSSSSRGKGKREEL